MKNILGYKYILPVCTKYLALRKCCEFYTWKDIFLLMRKKIRSEVLIILRGNVIAF